ncbi:MAG TPA: hypothetical protein VL651_09745 [Bacteroidia bacterium]|jgi:hypothetical protein|nr:hypothetical protein [Bacteroidia bacterium]
MKRSIRPLVILSFLFLFSCHSVHKIVVPQPSYLSISLDSRGMAVNGSLIPNSWTLKDFEAAMGTADSISGTAKTGNVVHIYNKFGVIMFETPLNKKPSGIIKEVMFMFTPEDNGFDQPRNMFSGELTIGSGKISKNTTPEKLKAQFVNWKHCDGPSMGHWYEFYNDNLFIYCAFNDSDNQLIWIDVGLMANHSPC